MAGDFAGVTATRRRQRRINVATPVRTPIRGSRRAPPTHLAPLGSRRPAHPCRRGGSSPHAVDAYRPRRRDNDCASLSTTGGLEPFGARPRAAAPPGPSAHGSVPAVVSEAFTQTSRASARAALRILSFCRGCDIIAPPSTPTRSSRQTKQTSHKARPPRPFLGADALRALNLARVTSNRATFAASDTARRPRHRAATTATLPATRRAHVSPTRFDGRADHSHPWRREPASPPRASSKPACEARDVAPTTPTEPLASRRLPHRPASQISRSRRPPSQTSTPRRVKRAAHTSAQTPCPEQLSPSDGRATPLAALLSGRAGGFTGATAPRLTLARDLDTRLAPRRRYPDKGTADHRQNAVLPTRRHYLTPTRQPRPSRRHAVALWGLPRPRNTTKYDNYDFEDFDPNCVIRLGYSRTSTRIASSGWAKVMLGETGTQLPLWRQPSGRRRSNWGPGRDPHGGPVRTLTSSLQFQGRSPDAVTSQE